MTDWQPMGRTSSYAPLVPPAASGRRHRRRGRADLRERLDTNVPRSRLDWAFARGNCQEGVRRSSGNVRHFTSGGFPGARSASEGRYFTGRWYATW